MSAASAAGRWALDHLPTDTVAPKNRWAWPRAFSISDTLSPAAFSATTQSARSSATEASLELRYRATSTKLVKVPDFLARDTLRRNESKAARSSCAPGNLGECLGGHDQPLKLQHLFHGTSHARGWCMLRISRSRLRATWV